MTVGNWSRFLTEDERATADAAAAAMAPLFRRHRKDGELPPDELAEVVRLGGILKTCERLNLDRGEVVAQETGDRELAGWCAHHRRAG